MRAAVNEWIKPEEVAAVEALIDAIGTLPETDAYKSAKTIWNAKEAYDELSEDYQGRVDGTKAAALETAVAAMEALQESFPAGRIGGEGNWSGASFAQSPWMAYNNFTAEERAAILAAMEDEIVYQYMHEGYDLGFLSVTTPKSVQEQEGLLYAEVGDGGDGGDNIPGCNPWAQANRQWAAVVAPYEGVAFSIKSPFGYLGVGNLLLLGNAFEYDGRVYLLTKNGVHSYDAATVPASSGDITTEAIFPGIDATGADVTNGTFAYAAALYNQAEKWNNKTVGIPSGNVELTADGDTYYQAFEGPDGEAYIVGDAAAVDAADANVPVEAAYVLDADDLAALLAATGAEDVVSALAMTGAPVAARPESGRWEFAKGYIADGSFTAYTAAQLVERAISAIPAIPEGGIADEATYDTIKAAYDSALADYNALEEAEQAEVENADVLTACAAALATFEEQLAAAEDMRDTLYALPYTVESIVNDTATDWATEIAAARTAYEALDDIEKALVTDTYYGYLEMAEAALEAAEVVTEYYFAVPEDYQEAWGALYEDEESYLAGEEYATYVAPLATAIENLSDDGYDMLEGSDYWTAIDEVLTWRPAEPGPGPDEPYTIEDVMAACRVVARNNAGGEPTSDELARYDMNGDSAVLIDDIMAICRELASYNLQQQ